MKKKITLICALLVTFSLSTVNAQQILNKSFESWSFQAWGGILLTTEADHWLSNNINVFDFSTGMPNTSFPVNYVTDAHDGGLSAKLTVVEFTDTTYHKIGGQLYATDFIDYNTGSATFQSIGSTMPDSMVFWYKCTSIDATSFFKAGFYVQDGNTTSSLTVDSSVVTLGQNSVNQWTRISLPISCGPQPEVFPIVVFSVDGAPGTELIVDDVQLIYNSSAGLKEIDLANFNIFPNPATDFIQFEFNDDLSHEIQIFDMQGREILKSTISKLNNVIDISNLDEGNYVVYSTNKAGEIIAKKITIKE